MRKSTLAAALAALSLAASAAGMTQPVHAMQVQQCGTASWYAMHTITASGERANPDAMVAAHKTLPFGTKVAVENLENGRVVVVRINDRGPYVGGRVIDLSEAAADQLGFVAEGTAPVRISVINTPISQDAC